jgi:SPP1 family predicted phage head-tail adaptor
MRAHPIHVGEMTELIELHSLTSTSDGMGGSTQAWAKYADVWAHIRPLSGSEREGAMRTEGTAKHLIVIRNRDDVRDTHKIVWGARELNIRFIRSRGPRDLYLELEAEVGVRI